MIGHVCSLGAQQSVGCWSVDKEVIAIEQEKFERMAQRGAAFASGAVLEMCKLGCASVSASDEHNFFIAPVLARLRQENRFVASEPLKFIQKFCYGLLTIWRDRLLCSSRWSGDSLN